MTFQNEDAAKYEPMVANPLLIETKEMAQEVLNWLNREIANIDAQLDAAAIQAGQREMPESKADWLRRACYAVAMKKRDYHKIYQRSRELRGIKGPSQTEPSHTKEEKALKHQRLLVEAETRRTAKQLQYQQAKNREAELAQKKRETELELLKLKATLGAAPPQGKE